MRNILGTYCIRKKRARALLLGSDLEFLIAGITNQTIICKAKGYKSSTPKDKEEQLAE
jgi:hypothetical protein